MSLVRGLRRFHPVRDGAGWGVETDSSTHGLHQNVKRTVLKNVWYLGPIKYRERSLLLVWEYREQRELHQQQHCKFSWISLLLNILIMENARMTHLGWKIHQARKSEISEYVWIWRRSNYKPWTVIFREHACRKYLALRQVKKHGTVGIYCVSSNLKYSYPISQYTVEKSKSDI